MEQEIINQVKVLSSEHGLGRKAIAHRTGLTVWQVRSILETSSELKAADEYILEEVQELVKAGFGRVKVAQALNLSKSVADRLVRRAKTLLFPDSKKAETFKELKANGATSVEIARATHMPVSSAMNFASKLEGGPESVDKYLKLDLAKGITLNRLSNRYGITTIEEVREHVEELFDNVMVATQPTVDGQDTSIVLIPDKTDSLKGLNISGDKGFRYFVNPDNNYMYVEFPEDCPDEIKIYNFTDLHIGAKHCRTELLKQHIRMVAEDPSAYVVLGGDIFDYMHKQSVGQPWEQKLAPMEQVTVSVRMLAPLAHKTIRYAGGNHDRDRGYKFVGADLADVLAQLLKVSYGWVETTIDFNFKGHIFTLLLHHGSGRGGNIGSIVSEAERYKQFSNYFVNWHMSGHVHNAQTVPGNALVKVLGKGLEYKRYFTVIGGSYLARSGTYAEEAKYKPTPQDLTYITMKSDGSYDVGKVAIDTV